MAASRWISQRGQEINCASWVSSGLLGFSRGVTGSTGIISKGDNTQECIWTGAWGRSVSRDQWICKQELRMVFSLLPPSSCSYCSPASQINTAYTCLNANLPGASMFLRHYLLKPHLYSLRLCVLLIPGTGLSPGSKCFLRCRVLAQPWYIQQQGCILSLPPGPPHCPLPSASRKKAKVAHFILMWFVSRTAYPALPSPSPEMSYLVTSTCTLFWCHTYSWTFLCCLNNFI